MDVMIVRLRWYSVCGSNIICKVAYSGHDTITKHTWSLHWTKINDKLLDGEEGIEEVRNAILSGILA